jgi:hypothetical protein
MIEPLTPSQWFREGGCVASPITESILKTTLAAAWEDYRHLPAHEYAEETRVALEAWANLLIMIINKDGDDNVVLTTRCIAR